MSEELKPCPFCNGQPELILPHGESFPQVRCTGCNAEVSSRFGKIAAINEWNIRLIEDALRDRAERVEAELARKDAEIKALDELVELYDTWTPLGHTVDWANKFEDARARLAAVRNPVN